MAAVSLSKFTVVLMRPDYMTRDFGQDCYVALVEAQGVYQAVREGQREVAAADYEDVEEGLRDPDGPEPHPEDYHPLLVFEGHHDVKLFGWQL